MAFRPDLWGIETEAEQLVSRLTRTLPVTAACVALWDQPSLTLTVRAVHTGRPVNGSLLVGARVALSNSTWRRIVLAPSEPDPPESGDDRRLDPERAAELALMPQARSMYLLPIRFAGETVGILALGEARSAEREPFSSEKRRHCQEILDEFVATTTHAWEARRLHRQARAMSSLMRLVRGVSAARSFDDVLASLAAEVADWLGIRVRGVLLGTAGKEIKLLARWQLPDDILGDGGRQLFLAMIRSAARGTGPIAVAVAGDDPLDPLTSVEPAAKNWTRIGVPLMKNERLVGLACLYLEEEICLADWELEAFRRRGEIVALGVEAVETALTVEAEQERFPRGNR
jgi:transcriptional regulator with GAF, ATPase, and Fis domain